MSAEPNSLEGALRGLLIALFYRLSDKDSLLVASEDPDALRNLNVYTPTLFKGPGKIIVRPNTVFGVVRSPGAFAYSFVDARTTESQISIGAGTTINNRASIISDGASITIGARCMIGPELIVTDSNHHEVAVEQRHIGDRRPRPVVIGDDVLIGYRVIILKGCNVGSGSVIAAGSVLPPSFEAPARSIIAGNPARIVGTVAEPAAAAPDAPPQVQG